MNVTETYVVTFDRRHAITASTLNGLRRMTLSDARATIALADRIPKHGMIVNVETLEIIA